MMPEGTVFVNFEIAELNSFGFELVEKIVLLFSVIKDSYFFQLINFILREARRLSTSC